VSRSRPGWRPGRPGHAAPRGCAGDRQRAALALGTATAYSAIVVAPVLIAFAFGVWLPGLQARRALYRAVWLAAAWLAFFSLLLTVSRSWAGLVFSVLDRRLNDYQSLKHGPW
jgi:hypothetical protein